MHPLELDYTCQRCQEKYNLHQEYDGKKLKFYAWSSSFCSTECYLDLAKKREYFGIDTEFSKGGMLPSSTTDGARGTVGGLLEESLKEIKKRNRRKHPYIVAQWDAGGEYITGPERPQVFSEENVARIFDVPVSITGTGSLSVFDDCMRQFRRRLSEIREDFQRNKK